MLWMVLEAGFTAPAVVPRRLSLSRSAVKWSAGPLGKATPRTLLLKALSWPAATDLTIYHLSRSDRQHSGHVFMELASLSLSVYLSRCLSLSLSVSHTCSFCVSLFFPTFHTNTNTHIFYHRPNLGCFFALIPIHQKQSASSRTFTSTKAFVYTDMKIHLILIVIITCQAMSPELHFNQ